MSAMSQLLPAKFVPDTITRALNIKPTNENINNHDLAGRQA
jgi:hypothetical protein